MPAKKNRTRMQILKDKIIKTAPDFSKTHLIVFAAAFAAVGGYVIMRSFAASDIVTDNFERSSLGSNWTLQGSGPGIINNSDLGILSGPSGLVYWTANSFADDQFSEGVLSSDINAEMMGGIFVRRRSSDLARYQLHYNFEKTPTQWEIKYDGVPNTETKILASSTTEPPAAPGDTLRIEAEGTTIRAYRNGSLILSANDTSAEQISSGRPGMAYRMADMSISGGGSVTNEPVFESWTAGSISSSPGDTTPPTVSLTAPTNGSTVSGSINITAAASDNVGVAGVQFKLGGSNFWPEDTSAPFSIPSWDTASVSNGTHTLQAVARDAAGNITNSSVFSITINNPPPSSSSDPAADDFERASLGSNWQLSQGSGGIVNNSDIGIPSGSISINSWVGSTFSNDQFSQAQISSDASSDMQKQVFVRRRASDGARYAFHYNIESSPLRWEIKYDGVPAAQTKLLASTSAVAGPAPGDTQRIEIEGDTIRGYLNGNLVLSAVDNSAEKITSGPPGLTFRLINNLNVSQPEPVFENWAGGSLAPSPGDTTPPSATVTSPANGTTVTTGSVNLAATATDNVAIAGVQFYLNYAGDPNSDKVGSEDTSSPYTNSLDTSTLNNGSHTITAIARDSAGNLSAPSTISITVANSTPPPSDTTPPSIPAGLNSPSKDTTSITLAWNASTDSGTGVAGYRLYRSTTGAGGTYSLLPGGDISAGSPRTYDDTGLAPNTTYYYKVIAYDNSANANALTDATALSVTTDVDTPAPAPPTPPTSTNRAADLNKDNAVNIFDLSILLTRYGSTDPQGDVNGSGNVDIFDLSILLSNYGT